MTSHIGPADGELLLRTGVTGSAARMGHRLTLVMRTWEATVSWDPDEPADPVGVEVVVVVDSLDVLRGEGGMTPLSGAEKALVRSNALKMLQAKKFPQARFRSTSLERSGSSVRIAGVLELAGRTGAVAVEVSDEAGAWRGEASVRHTDFGIKQYSMLMGAMKVADAVSVSVVARHS